MIFNTQKHLKECRPCIVVDGELMGSSATLISEHLDEFGLFTLTEKSELVEQLPSSSGKYLILDVNNNIFYLPEDTYPSVDIDVKVCQMDNGKLFCYPATAGVIVNFKHKTKEVEQSKRPQITNLISYRMKLLYYYDLSTYNKNCKLYAPGAAPIDLKDINSKDINLDDEDDYKRKSVVQFFDILQNICQERCLLAGAPIEMIEDNNLPTLPQLYQLVVEKAVEYSRQNPDADYEVWEVPNIKAPQPISQKVKGNSTKSKTEEGNAVIAKTNI